MKFQFNRIKNSMCHTETIHILTELCALGSLENILRDASGHFVNLLNANHQIDVYNMPIYLMDLPSVNIILIN